MHDITLRKINVARFHFQRLIVRTMLRITNKHSYKFHFFRIFIFTLLINHTASRLTFLLLYYICINLH